MDNYLSLLAEKVNPAHTALVVIDMQNDYLHPKGAYGQAGVDLQPVQLVVPAIQQIVDAARQVNVPVIYTRNWKTTWNASQVDLTHISLQKNRVGPNGVAESWGAEWYEVAPVEGDAVVSKARYDAFLGTDLEQILRAHRIQTLVFAGTQTNVCVESTARSAFMRDYFVVILEDATATINPEAHRASLENLANYFGVVLGVSELRKIWLATETLAS